jgi:hypothetical protein
MDKLSPDARDAAGAMAATTRALRAWFSAGCQFHITSRPTSAAASTPYRWTITQSNRRIKAGISKRTEAQRDDKITLVLLFGPLR